MPSAAEMQRSEDNAFSKIVEAVQKQDETRYSRGHEGIPETWQKGDSLEKGGEKKTKNKARAMDK